LHQSVPHAGVGVRDVELVLLFDRDHLEHGGWHEDARYETQTFWWQVCVRGSAARAHPTLRLATQGRAWALASH